jgi:hypothetical protein
MKAAMACREHLAAMLPRSPQPTLECFLGGAKGPENSLLLGGQ